MAQRSDDPRGAGQSYDGRVENPANADRHAHLLVPACSPELYRGTADYYSRFRPRYPPVLLDAIERTVGLDRGDTLLDVGCGTGEVSLAFADRIAQIWAIDLESEMVAVARQNALDRGIGRIHWLVGRAEEAELPEDHFGLVAVGRAFHRLNRPLIAQRSTRWLRSTSATLAPTGLLTETISAYFVVGRNP